MPTDKFTLRKIMRAKLHNYFFGNCGLRTELSGRIWNLLQQLPAFKKAEMDNSLMVYLDIQNEAETTRFIKLPVIVPFCQVEEIVPFRLFSLDELEVSIYDVLEPKTKLREKQERILTPESVKVVIIPGLAFDVAGNRLGRGKGFYDRFISKLTKSTITIALCYEFQILESIPVTASDKSVNIIVTENRIIYC
ncbi:MAG: 5-formyltetrahydrofolate cyclo-ligase [Planctomycetaceae bacterium]|nr:5-formyltetrahydrofolate cyclo-ligase [Planctomycetaceae bacterium]